MKKKRIKFDLILTLAYKVGFSVSNHTKLRQRRNIINGKSQYFLYPLKASCTLFALLRISFFPVKKYTQGFPIVE